MSFCNIHKLWKARTFGFLYAYNIIRHASILPSELEYPISSMIECLSIHSNQIWVASMAFNCTSMSWLPTSSDSDQMIDIHTRQSRMIFFKTMWTDRIINVSYIWQTTCCQNLVFVAFQLCHLTESKLADLPLEKRKMLLQNAKG